MTLISNIIVCIGTLMLLHAVYSAHHFKSLAAKIGQLDDVSIPPMDVVVEAGVSFIIILVGQLLPLNFTPIRITESKVYKSWEENMGRPDYLTFNHRGIFLGK
eukprot:gene618-1192_t